MQRLPSHRQQQPWGQELRHVLNITASGCMTGTAILFPLANVEGFGFRAVTLSIFIVSTLGFHALYHQSFVRCGPFTAAAGLVFLLVAVLATGSSRAELIPWLPLFVGSLSLITVVTYEISQRVRPQPVSLTAEDHEFSGVSIDTWSERSSRTMSTQQGFQALLESNRLDHIFFALHGPPSRTSNRTGTDATDITLSSVVGRCRPEWDAQTRSHFPHIQTRSQNNALPEREVLSGAYQRSPSPTGGSSPEPDMDLESDRGSLESSQPLLGPQGGPAT